MLIEIIENGDIVNPEDIAAIIQYDRPKKDSTETEKTYRVVIKVGQTVDYIFLNQTQYDDFLVKLKSSEEFYGINGK